MVKIIVKMGGAGNKNFNTDRCALLAFCARKGFFLNAQRYSRTSFPQYKRLLRSSVEFCFALALK
jgi:hypothetical protein